jgi:hypothetical protein
MMFVPPVRAKVVLSHQTASPVSHRHPTEEGESSSEALIERKFPSLTGLSGQYVFIKQRWKS